MIVAVAIIFAVGFLAAIVLFFRAQQEQAAARWLANRRTVLLKILVPKNNDKTPAAAEHLFAALHGIFRSDARFQDYLSFEIAARAKAIEFYVQCPVELRDFVEGQVYAQYPNIDIQEVQDYARIDATGLKIGGMELKLNKADVYPIKTFPNFEVDPLAGITSVLSSITDRDQIWIQTLVQPVSDSWQNKGLGYAAAVRSGTLQNESIFSLIVKGLFGIFRPPPPAESAKPAAASGPARLAAPKEQALKAVEEKATKLGFATKIRIVVIAPDATTVNAKLNAVTGAYKQFNTVNMNGFSQGKVVSDTKIVDEYRLRTFGENNGIFNIEELASVFHFPNVSVETPNIVWAGAKKGEPPASLPVEGVIPPEELTVFGLTDFRGVREKFGIKIGDRRQHMYAIGKSGTGKSTLLENMAIDDIRKGRGVAIVDPHGDFVNHVLDFIPASRINDVIYFNPADKDYPIGFNLLENVDPKLKNVVASGVVGIFKKLFAESWGPRLEYILRNVVMALLEYPNATILGIMKVLVDKKYRDQVIGKLTDPVIRDFFINEYEKYDPKFRTEAIAPIQNKVGQFLSASTIRNILGQPKSTFDIEEAMNTRKILLLDLSIGKIGEDAAALLGSMMITKIQLAAMRRAAIDEKDRADFYLYVDEFQNFATESFAVILSEARKYHLNLIMTNQYIAQMPEEVAKAIFGNIGTLISFRVGASDAVALVKEFEPVFEANDLINLDNHHIYAKMSIDGVTRPAFSAITLAPASESNNNKEKVIRVSREHYTRPRDFVEKKIAEASVDGGENFPSTSPVPSREATTASPKPVRSDISVQLKGQTFLGREGKDGEQWFTSDNQGDSREVVGEEAITPSVISQTESDPMGIEAKVVTDASLVESQEPVTKTVPSKEEPTHEPAKQTVPASESKKQAKQTQDDKKAGEKQLLKPTDDEDHEKGTKTDKPAKPAEKPAAAKEDLAGSLKEAKEKQASRPATHHLAAKANEVQTLKAGETIVLRD